MKITTEQLKTAICQHLEQEFIPKTTSKTEKGVIYGAMYLIHTNGEMILDQFAKNSYAQMFSFSNQDGTINAAKLYDMATFIIGKVDSITIDLAEIASIPLIGNVIRPLTFDSGDIEKIMSILKNLTRVV